MKKIIEYQIVTGDMTTGSFNKAVNALIKKGFQPFGPVSTTVDERAVLVAQAMVKYED